MLLVNGKAMLKIDNRYIPPGEEMEVPEGLAKKLKDVGLAAEPKEKAKPRTKKAKKAGA